MQPQLQPALLKLSQFFPNVFFIDLPDNVRFFKSVTYEWLVRSHAVIFGNFMGNVVLLAAPFAGLLARHPLADSKRPRSVIYLGSAINLIVIGSITAAIDLWDNREALHALTLFPPE